jgi:hypothetical protein
METPAIKTYIYTIKGKHTTRRYIPKQEEKVKTKIVSAVNDTLKDMDDKNNRTRLWEKLKVKYPDLKCSQSYFMKVVRDNNLFAK